MGYTTLLCEKDSCKYQVSTKGYAVPFLFLLNPDSHLTPRGHAVVSSEVTYSPGCELERDVS